MRKKKWVIMEAFFLLRFFLILLTILVLSGTTYGASYVPTALVYQSDARSAFGGLLADELRQSGLSVMMATSDTLIDGIKSQPDAVVLPDARRFPAVAVKNLIEYLQHGGYLTVVGSPAFEEMLYRHNDQWFSSSEALKEIAKEAPQLSLYKFVPGDEKDWTRDTNHPEFDERLSVGEGALAGFVSDVTGPGWNTYLSKPITKPIPADHTLTVFEARGDRNTPRIFVEWREQDGSRWMADVKITERWTRYVLRPADFKYWAGTPVPDRGGLDDRVHLPNAKQLSIGLAENFGLLPRGNHIWWIRDIGVSSDPTNLGVRALKLQTLSPDYTTYPMSNINSIRTRSDQALVDGEFSLSGPIAGRMPIWRPRGLGYSEKSKQSVRFIPILDAFDKNSEWRGSPAWFYLHFDGTFANSYWAAIGMNGNDLKGKPQQGLAHLAASMTARLFSAPFLQAGGTTGFALEPIGNATTGAVTASRPELSEDTNISVLFTQEGKTQSWVEASHERQKSDGYSRWQHTDIGYQAIPGPARIVTQLWSGGKVVDALHQPLSILGKASDDLILAEGGQFVLGGKPFYANGVNYFPRSTTGVDQREFEGSWLDPGNYDPEIIERDLQLLETNRVNVVSIQYMHPTEALQVVDFLDRCHRHGIWAHIFVAGANPIDPNLSLLKKLIVNAGLGTNPAVFSYDLAWEPNLGKQDRRSNLDSKWNEWIVEQYGTLDDAAKDWDFEPTSTHTPTKGYASPSDDQLVQDGSWRRYVAAYRRFADDTISRGYGTVARFVRKLDSHHLLGARTGYGGTGQLWIVPAFPFDLSSGMAHLDYSSPEGYGITGDLDNYLAAGFTTEYGRFVSGGKPVFWAEYGLSIWPNNYDQKTLDAQAEHISRSYQLYERSYANGSAAWWFTGGLRVDEKSDYGVVTADGKARPSLTIIAQHASTPTRPPQATSTVLIDRDIHTNGYAGIWQAARDEYLKAIKSGGRLVPRSEGTGSTSKSCPAVAVGNSPWTGNNPSKYLNAEIAYLEVQNPNGQWIEADGSVIKVKSRTPIVLRAQAVNTGEAKWLAKTPESGEVALEIKCGNTVFHSPLSADVDPLKTTTLREITLPELEKGTFRLSMRMSCSARGRFGQRLRLTVEAEE
ncbi:MAG: hypothetical protein WCL39_01415 [Armatimonadota bacterium]